MMLTRREKHVLIAVGILIPVLAFIPQQIINNAEPLYTLLLVGPLGFYIATDPERRNKKAPEGAGVAE